jgi:hypothetical protein
MDQRLTAIADTARLQRLFAGAVHHVLDKPGIECQCLGLAVKPTDLSYARRRPRLRTLLR